MGKLSEYDLRPGDWVVLYDDLWRFTARYGGDHPEADHALFRLKDAACQWKRAHTEITAAYRPSYEVVVSAHPFMCLTELKPREEKPAKVQTWEEAHAERKELLKRAEAAEKERDELREQIACLEKSEKVRFDLACISAKQAEERLSNLAAAIIKICHKEALDGK